jgi:hypothetical protein
LGQENLCIWNNRIWNITYNFNVTQHHQTQGRLVCRNLQFAYNLIELKGYLMNYIIIGEVEGKSMGNMIFCGLSWIMWPPKINQ